MARTRVPGKRKQGAGDDVDPRYIVPGLSRGLTLLQLFSRKQSAQTLAELAGRMKLSRSATYRLVYTLHQDGFLARDDESRRYRLTSKALSLGFDFLDSQAITEIAQPFLRQLSDRTSAAVHIAILDGWNAVYLSRVMPAVALVTNLQVGARLPAHVTSSGRMLLAHQDDDRLETIYGLLKAECRLVPPPASAFALLEQAQQDRRRGYVFHRSIMTPGISSIACPVFEKSGVAAAITVIGPDQAMQALGGEKVLKVWVGETASHISRRMGYAG